MPSARSCLLALCLCAAAPGAFAQAPARTFVIEDTRRAAEGGDAAAQYQLGMAYYRGVGVAPDEAGARYWIGLAAATGYAPAQYHLGAAYLTGRGVPQDDRTAAALLEQAAMGGHAEAQYVFATLLTNGRGVERDHAWAALWYLKAARQGIAAAQSMLGVAYQVGFGLPVDNAAALQWTLIAARAGDAASRRATELVTAKVPEPERAAIQRTATAWAPSPDGGPADRASILFLQLALQRLGYDPGPPDGLMGARTQTAIEQFRKDSTGGNGGVSYALLSDVRTALNKLPPAR